MLKATWTLNTAYWWCDFKLICFLSLVFIPTLAVAQSRCHSWSGDYANLRKPLCGLITLTFSSRWITNVWISFTNTETPMSRQTARFQTQGGAVRWTCRGRCGGEPVCRLTLCRRRERHPASPDTPPPCWCQRRAAWGRRSSRFCDRLWIYRGTPGSRTHRSDRSSCRHLDPSFWFSCRPLQYSPSPPSPLPSNSAQSAPVYTAPAASGWTSAGGPGTAVWPGQLSLFSDPQIEPACCWQYLGPAWVRRHLEMATDYFFLFVLTIYSNWKSDKHTLTLPLTWLQPLESTTFQTEKDV